MSLFDLTGTEKNIKKILLISLINFLGGASCTIKKSADTKDDPSAEAQKTVIVKGKASVVVPFPHPQNFKNIEEHGVFAITNGRESCKNCHGVDGDETGGSSQVSCNSCHATYPHDRSIIGNHSVLYAGDSENSCTNCHESEVNSSISGQSGVPPKCNACHETWPHLAGWLDDSSLEFHGVASLRSGNNACLNCHENTLETSTTSTASRLVTENKGKCVSCHENYPHQKDFVSGHGEFLFNSNDGPVATIETCLTCHKEDFGSGSEVRTQVPTCNSCHTMYPHPKNFTAPGTQDFHGELAKGSQSSACLICHKKDENQTVANTNAVANQTQHSRITASSAPTCSACHNNYPHAETWLKTGEHGAEWLKDKTTCLQCHTSSTENGVEGFCQNCHNYPHPKDFILTTRHPMFEFNHTLEEGQCLLCHNESKEKAVGIPSCNTCHEKSTQR